MTSKCKILKAKNKTNDPTSCLAFRVILEIAVAKLDQKVSVQKILLRYWHMYFIITQ